MKKLFFIITAIFAICFMTSCEMEEPEFKQVKKETIICPGCGMSYNYDEFDEHKETCYGYKKWEEEHIHHRAPQQGDIIREHRYQVNYMLKITK